MKLRPWIVLKPKNLFFAVYLMVSTALLVFLIEVALWGVDFVTGGKVPLLARSNYPSDPGNWLKIAIVGESAAKGVNAEYGFEQVLMYELPHRFNRGVYIRNYAQAAFPFHGYQAEIVKANMQRYDVFLIYAGHNEVHNYIDRVGKFSKPQFKGHHMFRVRPGDDLSWVARLFDYHSRIYSLIYRYKQRALDTAVEKAGGWNLSLNPNEFMPEAVLPLNERRMIDTNFQADLEEIGRLAQKYNKQVVIMSAPSCEDWKPMFSVCNSGLSKEASAGWSKEYRQGELLYREGNHQEALTHFQTAHAIDGGVAILNYWIGMALAHLGRLEESHKFLRLAIDTDGFPVRALNSLFTIEESVADKFPNVHYCNMVEVFENLVDHGCKWRQLFADFQHPSFAGHVVIAYGFLSKIAEIESFSFRSPNVDSTKLNDLVAFYHKEFGFSPRDLATTAWVRVCWACKTLEISAYPDDFLALAEESFRVFLEKTDKGSKGEREQAYKDFMALIQARRTERRTNQ